MGQNQSGEDFEESLSREIDYLAEHTSLNQEQLRNIYDKYFAEKKISKKDFTEEFKTTFPK